MVFHLDQDSREPPSARESSSAEREWFGGLGFGLMLVKNVETQGFIQDNSPTSCVFFLIWSMNYARWEPISWYGFCSAGVDPLPQGYVFPFITILCRFMHTASWCERLAYFGRRPQHCETLVRCLFGQSRGSCPLPYDGPRWGPERPRTGGWSLLAVMSDWQRDVDWLLAEYCRCRLRLDLRWCRRRVGPNGLCLAGPPRSGDK
jgi:hypothetical protein